MVSFYRLTILCVIAIIFGVFMFFAIIWEPYCFFVKPYYSNDLSTLMTSDIYTVESSNSSSDSKDLIVVLVPRISTELIRRLELIDVNFDDHFSTNLLLLLGNDPYRFSLVYLTKRIKRKVFFLNVGVLFNLFPSGFDPCRVQTSYRVRGKWNYLMMIRFWFKHLFELPQLKNYEYIMRLDDDSKMTGHWINAFDEMRRRKAVYFANNVDIDIEEQLPGTMKLKQVTYEYLKQNHIEPKQPQVLRDAFGNNTVRNYYNNFEIIKMEFFRRKEIRQWIESIDSTNGIFHYRWGDAILRYLTFAIFAKPNQVLHRPDYNLSYCHKCP
ncbi:unnamed protein product [Adineta ricciae]|uniref:Uncharacterized protein n=1 Tax=Adineta ricciae TaxID=249248 RepID=A0A814GKX5_ADIRI|nr:unnamed protein product [Adineta ricciae]